MGQIMETINVFSWFVNINLDGKLVSPAVSLISSVVMQISFKDYSILKLSDTRTINGNIFHLQVYNIIKVIDCHYAHISIHLNGQLVNFDNKNNEFNYV